MGPVRIVTLRLLAGVAALAVCALAAAAGGLPAVPDRAWQVAGVSRVAGAVLALSVAALLCGLVLALLLSARRPPRGPRTPERVVALPGTRLERLLVGLGAVVALVAVAGFLIFVVSRFPSGSSTGAAHPSPATSPPTATGPPRPSPTRKGAAGTDSELWATLAGAGALALAAAGAVVAARRGAPAPALRQAAPSESGEIATAWADALRAAASRLPEYTGSPRAAVIAAYGAMAASLESRRRLVATQTPGRLIERAAALGLIEPADGRELVGLFERARFSTHPVEAGDQLAAERVLARAVSRGGP